MEPNQRMNELSKLRCFCRKCLARDYL